MLGVQREPSNSWIVVSATGRPVQIAVHEKAQKPVTFGKVHIQIVDAVDQNVDELPLHVSDPVGPIKSIHHPYPSFADLDSQIAFFMPEK